MALNSEIYHILIHTSGKYDFWHIASGAVYAESDLTAVGEYIRDKVAPVVPLKDIQVVRKCWITSTIDVTDTNPNP